MIIGQSPITSLQSSQSRAFSCAGCKLAGAIAKLHHRAINRVESFPRNHFGFIVSAEMTFPLFRICSRAAGTSAKKFARGSRQVFSFTRNNLALLRAFIFRTEAHPIFTILYHKRHIVSGEGEVASVYSKRIPIFFLSLGVYFVVKD